MSGCLEFEDSPHAKDTAVELINRELHGQRLMVERGRGHYNSSSWGSRSAGGGDSSRRASGGDRCGLPVYVGYRLIVENPFSRCSWQDSKDFMWQAGEVTEVDAHRECTNEVVIELCSYWDTKCAVDKMDSTEINGRNVSLVEDEP